MISNQMNLFCEIHFIFRENSIILKDGHLPEERIMRRCLELSAASDWFAEIEYNYSAIMLEKDEPNPAGCTDMPLREFFHRTAKDHKIEHFGSLAARAMGLLNFRKNKRYCAKCGAQLVDDECFTARTCPACKTPFFPQLEPAMIVLVSKGDDYLLARHAQRNTDVYTCLAGFIEIGETAEQAVRRETYEETGIKIKNIRYVASQAWPFPDQLMLAFRAEYESGEIKVQEDEIQEAAWFNKKDLPKIPGPGSVAYNLITGVFG